MIKKIEHIGIAIKNIENARKVFNDIFQQTPYKTEAVDSEKVETYFYALGQSKLELLTATEKDSVIEKYIEKNGEGIHHIAFEVDDIHYEMNRLKSLGYRILNEQPKKGADNKLICFLHPKETTGILIELCMEITE